MFWGYHSSTPTFWKQTTKTCHQHVQGVMFPWYGLLFSTLALSWNILMLLRVNTYWQTYFFANESSLILSVVLTLRRYLIWLVVEPTPLKNMSQIGSSSPNQGVKYVSNMSFQNMVSNCPKITRWWWLKKKIFETTTELFRDTARKNP